MEQQNELKPCYCINQYLVCQTETCEICGGIIDAGKPAVINTSAYGPEYFEMLDAQLEQQRRAA